MIVVKVELWSARTKQARPLALMTISNRGDHPIFRRGNYDVRVARKGKLPDDKPLRVGEVLDFPRHSYHVLRLVLRALKSAFPEEK